MVKKKVVAKKKKWVKILAPKIFNNNQIGESLVTEPEVLVGRCIDVSLMVVIGDPQKQNIHVKFKITRIDNGVAHTELLAYRLMPTAAKRLMRRNKDKIDDSFVLETSDKKIVRIKPIVVLRNKTTGSVLTAMRMLVRAHLARKISKIPAEKLFTEIIGKQLQREAQKILRRLYPVGICEIRSLELIPVEKVKELGLSIMAPPAEKESTKEKPAVQEA